jgi:hypothetical protein
MDAGTRATATAANAYILATAGRAPIAGDLATLADAPKGTVQCIREGGAWLPYRVTLGKSDLFSDLPSPAATGARGFINGFWLYAWDGAAWRLGLSKTTDAYLGSFAGEAACIAAMADLGLVLTDGMRFGDTDTAGVCERTLSGGIWKISTWAVDGVDAGQTWDNVLAQVYVTEGATITRTDTGAVYRWTDSIFGGGFGAPVAADAYAAGATTSPMAIGGVSAAPRSPRSWG